MRSRLVAEPPPQGAAAPSIQGLVKLDAPASDGEGPRDQLGDQVQAAVLQGQGFKDLDLAAS